MRFLVSYDIACSRRRLRVSNLLLGYGERVQESVFALELREGQWQALCQRLDATIDPTLDQWRGWRACADDQADTQDLGAPSPPLRVGATVV